MRLDVVVCTWNRAELLDLCLGSFASAAPPTNLDLAVIVVDNNSTDSTAAVVKKWQEKCRFPIKYVVETRQGISYARNTGITSSDADFVGFVDDDEHVDPMWPTVAAQELVRGDVDAVGGPCYANWKDLKPTWLPEKYGAVYGQAYMGDERTCVGPDWPFALIGGNVIYRRSLLNEIGLYDARLSTGETRKLFGEDVDVYRRAIQRGCRAVYQPQLIVFHHVFPARMTKRYFRRWVFWDAVSVHFRRKRAGAKVPLVLGMDRWVLQAGLEEAFKLLFRLPSVRHPAKSFRAELRVIEAAGELWGRLRYGSQDASVPLE